jgi:UPF0716 protein FxsA
MRFFVALILLAFPIAEIWLLIELADQYGWLLLLYLVAIGWLGLRLIREEKALGTARNIIAGVLLMLPGVITDIIAVTLLLIPIKNAQPLGEPPSNGSSRTSPYQAANDDVIEGEFRRED